MKPYLLRLQAFGPFSSKQEVCFDDVFEGGLFLIHGRTGAGKTSLLDGLCFSLFGRPSTPEREKDLRALRSDLAPPELLTESELIFAIGSEVFKVHRVPSQTVPKKRGEGTTEFKGSAELWRLHAPWPEHREQRLKTIELESNWTPVAAKQEAVDREIELILGMNERQFRQVVILPQGKFREFLSSSSAERQTILERLFQTDRFSRFQSFLTQYHKQLEAKWKSRTDFVISRLQGFGIESVQALPAEIQARESRFAEIAASLSLLRDRQIAQTLLVHRLEILEQSQARLRDLEKSIAALHQQSDSILKMKSQVQAHDRLVKYLALRETLQAVEKRISSNRARTDDFKLRLKDTKTSHERSLANLKTLLETTPALETLKSDYQRLRDLYPALKALISDLAAKEQDVTLMQSTLDESHAQSEKLKQTIQLGASTYLGLRNAHDDLLKDESRTIEEGLTAIKALEFLYHSTQAAALATELKLNEACPVCGSLDHPNPAKAHGEAISKEQLELARQKHQTVIDDTRLRQERRSARLTQIEKYLGDLKLDSLKATSVSDFQKTAETLERDLLSSQDTLKELAAKVAATKPRLEEALGKTQATRQELEKISPEERDLQAIAKRGSELKAEIEKREQQQDQLKALIASDEKKLAELTAHLEAAENEFQSASEEVLKLRTGLKTELETAGFLGGPPDDLVSKPERDRFEKLVSEHEAALTRTQGALKETLERVNENKAEAAALLKAQNLEHPDLSLARGQRDQLEIDVRTKESQSAKLSVEIENLKKLRSDVEKEEAELALIRDESDRTIRLTALVNGDRSQNKLSVPLSRFVLQSRFEDVLDQANRRLTRMSRGRYLLRRPALSRNLAQSQGLNLSVEDSVTGKERHADSLSGGESFMAALSLALGLADVVQSNLGGVRLDSVLIDEGFGTLDAESLDLALRTLIDLQAGGRMVGVISHVQELKSQIDRRLELLATPQGSRIRWENEALVSSRYKSPPAPPPTVSN